MILSGTELSKQILARVKNTIEEEKITPRLVVVQVGDDAASTIYVNRKTKAAQSVGIAIETMFFETATTEELVSAITGLNERPDVDAILIQLPLPASIDTQTVIESMDPIKDVDGFHPDNIAHYLLGLRDVQPVLLQAISWLLSATHQNFKGKTAAIVGKSDVFLKPLAYLLALLGMSVHWVKYDELAGEPIPSADVLVVALGRPHMIMARDVKPGATIIDIGISRTPDGKIVGDVQFDEVSPIVAWITPTPGGVGPVTIAALMWNTLLLALNKADLS